jgi:hypothetical protein
MGERDKKNPSPSEGARDKRNPSPSERERVAVRAEGRSPEARAE